MGIRRTLTTLTLSGLLVLGTTGVAAAQEAPPVASERLEAACARVPRIRARIEAALDRWNAGADVRGSEAWLEARAAELREEGRTDRAEVVESTIRVRTERIDVLEARLDRLDEIEDLCVEEGL